jgi:hypothetical protein
VYGLRQLVMPLCFALAAPLYSRAVAVPVGRPAFLQPLAVVLCLGGAFMGAGALFPRLLLRVVYGAAFVGASRYMVLYGLALTLQMASVISMFYQIARKSIVPMYLLVPIITMTIGTVLPDLTIPKLIAAQALAWGLYLLGLIWVHRASLPLNVVDVRA